MEEAGRTLTRKCSPISPFRLGNRKRAEVKLGEHVTGALVQKTINRNTLFCLHKHPTQPYIYSKLPVTVLLPSLLPSRSLPVH